MSDTYRAVMYDHDGYVMSAEELAYWVQEWESHTDSGPNEVMVVTGTAMPFKRHPDDTSEKGPGSYKTLDVIAEWDVSTEDATDVLARWEMAQRIATLLNKEASE